MQEKRPATRGDATGDRWVKGLFQEIVLVDPQREASSSVATVRAGDVGESCLGLRNPKVVMGT